MGYQHSNAEREADRLVADLVCRSCGGGGRGEPYTEDREWVSDPCLLCDGSGLSQGTSLDGWTGTLRELVEHLDAGGAVIGWRGDDGCVELHDTESILYLVIYALADLLGRPALQEQLAYRPVVRKGVAA